MYKLKKIMRPYCWTLRIRYNWHTVLALDQCFRLYLKFNTLLSLSEFMKSECTLTVLFCATVLLFSFYHTISKATCIYKHDTPDIFYIRIDKTARKVLDALNMDFWFPTLIVIICMRVPLVEMFWVIVWLALETVTNLL